MRWVFVRGQPLGHKSVGVEPHGIQFSLQFRSVGQFAVVCLCSVGFRNTNSRCPHRPVVIKRLLVDIVEEGAQRIKIMLRGWVKFMVVTHRATNRNPHERGSKRFCALASDVHPQLLWNRAAFVAAHPQAHVSTPDQGFKVLHRHEVAGDLLHSKLVERLVVVERADHVVAVGPNVPAVVIMQAVRISVSGVVEPIARALFAEGRLGKQPVDKMLISIG